ncbi:UpxY family transcription antiterminator [Phocaeicola oris]|uniref:UpxY family transcription antiterminator n=1 Tax=Phocaeicola oris TaxID=2896850 RepID=UPI00234F5E22|nr:UpxY family transcription antiterminator [Phocaeicola oris]MCE2617220.1 UpxY family transcription antiterminator [Phocaeicola oris]
MTQTQNVEEKKIWFVLRCTYSRGMKVKDYLDSNQIENFIPMHYVVSERQEKIIRKLVPVISNLIFVHCTKGKLEELKKTSTLQSLIRYIMDKEKHKPLIVPDKQMYDFIAVAGRTEEQILYLSPEEVKLREGDKVRINSGIWKGVEGVFLKVREGMRVVVSIEGFVAVATIALHPSMVDKI